MIWRFVLPVLAGLLLVLFAGLLPERFLRGLLQLALNAAVGLLLLVLVNSFTTLALPVNALTVTVGSLLGAPGMAALALLAAV
ncbi:MAG: pro-sigmaK processing inhibitor BofA family protein [Firmicutes bacterium]|nr:pro-sigmaK processing inhibitor BofA family protein [Bacillota bacterium]